MKINCAGFLLALMLASATSGCALSELVAAPKPVQNSVGVSSSSPEVGVVSVARVGENVFSDERFQAIQTFTATLLDDASGTLPVGRKVQFEKGQAAQLQRSYDGFNLVCYSYKEMTLHTECIVDKNGSGAFDHARAAEQKGDFALTKPARYAITPNKLDAARRDANLKRELIFQGISKGAIKLSFREFANDLMRPALIQDMTYELARDGSADIAFKSLRIKVIKVSSTEVTYTVLKTFFDA